MLPTSRLTLMRSPIPTRPSLLVAAAALAAFGCGEEEDVSPTYEDRIPAGLELEASDRVLTWGEATTLTGTLSRGEEVLGDAAVELEADSYPFDGSFSEVEASDTDAKGRFEFEDAPDANTAYRVASGELSETTSREVRVFVKPRTKLETEPASRGTRFTTVFRHPDERSIAGSNIYSYAATVADAEATGQLRFIRTDRVEQERLGLSSASIVLPFEAGEVEYGSCFSFTPDSGMGAANATCSQSRIPFRD